MKKEQNLWHIHSTKENSLEYILPKRDYDRFWEEGKLQAKEIQPKIKETDTVLEYGCGVGRILTNIKCKKKYGADISKNYLDRIEDEKIIPLNSNGRRLELKNECANPNEKGSYSIATTKDINVHIMNKIALERLIESQGI